MLSTSVPPAQRWVVLASVDMATHRAQTLWYVWGGASLQWSRNLRLNSQSFTYTGTVSRFLPFFFLFLPGAMHPADSLLKTPRWFVCSPSEALVRSRYCRASREASDAEQFITVWGWAFTHESLTLLSFSYYSSWFCTVIGGSEALLVSLCCSVYLYITTVLA